MQELYYRFDNVALSVRLATGTMVSIERRTEITKLTSGFEQRNMLWAMALRHYNITTGIRPMAEIQALANFFEARNGQLAAFRWKDWLDYKSCDIDKEITPLDQICQRLDDNGRYFCLQKIYGNTRTTPPRAITLPRADTVQLAIDGVAAQSGTFQVDALRGRVRTRRPAGADAKVTAGFEFDVPVRFDTDKLDVEIISSTSARVTNLPLIEVRRKDDK